MCDFDAEKRTKQVFETLWKRRRDEERLRGINCVKQIARIASGVISYQLNGNTNELRLILNFKY